MTYSPVLALMRDVSGEIHFDGWRLRTLALSCNLSSRSCRKASHCTCGTWTSVQIKTKIVVFFCFSLKMMNDSLLDGQTAGWRPAKQRSWTGRRKSWKRSADLWCFEQYFENCISWVIECWLIFCSSYWLFLLQSSSASLILFTCKLWNWRKTQLNLHVELRRAERRCYFTNECTGCKVTCTAGGSRPRVELRSALDQTQQWLFSLDADVLPDELPERSWERWSERSECLAVCLGSFLNV